MKQCPKCNRSFDDHETFCGFDGTRLPVAGAPASAPAPQSQSVSPAQVPVGTPVRTEAPRVASAPTAADPVERITCEWCQGMNQKTALSCWACGAPLDIKHLVLLWKDDQTPMSVMPLQGGVKRALAGMPFIISIAHGPGRIAFSRDATGELVVLPLHPGMELDVREHAFLLASHHINYSYLRIKGLRNILFGGQGMFMDRFVTSDQPGLLLLHGYGNVFERVLRPGESIMIEPGAFLYKDSAVTMNVESQKLTTGFFGGK